MCGFLGEFLTAGVLPETEDFEKLLSLSKHRGPDRTSVRSEEWYRLGFNRLAIQDLSEAGDQPVKSPSGRFHLVFNGEIYNFKDLAGEFQIKNLRSSSDTEILCHLLDEIGIEEAVSKLNGMFSIAIVDKVEKSLFLIRDFAGIKPLFYGIQERGVVFASQFDQIFKHNWFHQDLSLRPEIMKEYFGLGYMQAPNTIYRNIFQVNPGETVKIDFEQKTTRALFEQMTVPRKGKVQEDDSTASAFNLILSEVVKRQLISDRPVGTFLSGGIDSPLVAAQTKKYRKKLQAFTLKVNEHEPEEIRKAENYARELELEHHLLTVDEQDLLGTIDTHFKSFSEPFGDYSSIPTYLVTKKAKEYFTVMLSGDGGDELFWGYPRMLDVINKRLWFLVPHGIRKPINQLSNFLGLTKTHAPFFFKTLDDFILNKQLKIGSDRLDEIFPSKGFSVEMNRLYSNFSILKKNQLLKELKRNEFYGHLQRVLIKVDRTSMYNSMEVRVPLLDKHVIEFSNSLEPGLGISHKINKKVLKAALREILPSSTISKNKRGFNVPIEKWLLGPLRKDLDKIVFFTEIYGSKHLEVKALRQYVRDFLQGENNSGWGVWQIYAWQKWAQLHHNLKDSKE